MSQLVVNMKDNQGFDLILGAPVDSKGKSSGTIKEGSTVLTPVTDGIVEVSGLHVKAGAELGSTQINVSVVITPDDADESEETVTDFFTVVNESGKTTGLSLSASAPVDEA